MIAVSAELFRAGGVWCVRLRNIPEGVADELHEDVQERDGKLYISSIGKLCGASTVSMTLMPVPK